MVATTVFINNRTQAVRLPAELRLPSDIKRVDVRARGHERFRQHDGRMAISAITLAELMHGVEKSAKAAQHYGAIRAALEMRGETIGVNELHIAAHARSEGLNLVTNNVGEFDQVDSLLLENWAI